MSSTCQSQHKDQQLHLLQREYRALQAKYCTLQLPRQCFEGFLITCEAGQRIPARLAIETNYETGGVELRIAGGGRRAILDLADVSSVNLIPSKVNYVAESAPPNDSLTASTSYGYVQGIRDTARYGNGQLEEAQVSCSGSTPFTLAVSSYLRLTTVAKGSFLFDFVSVLMAQRCFIILKTFGDILVRRSVLRRQLNAQFCVQQLYDFMHGTNVARQQPVDSILGPNDDLLNGPAPEEVVLERGYGGNELYAGGYSSTNPGGGIESAWRVKRFDASEATVPGHVQGPIFHLPASSTGPRIPTKRVSLRNMERVPRTAESSSGAASTYPTLAAMQPPQLKASTQGPGSFHTVQPHFVEDTSNVSSLARNRRSSLPLARRLQQLPPEMQQAYQVNPTGSHPLSTKVSGTAVGADSSVACFHYHDCYNSLPSAPPQATAHGYHLASGPTVPQLQMEYRAMPTPLSWQHRCAAEPWQQQLPFLQHSSIPQQYTRQQQLPFLQHSSIPQQYTRQRQLPSSENESRRWIQQLQQSQRRRQRDPGPMMSSLSSVSTGAAGRNFERPLRLERQPQVVRSDQTLEMRDVDGGIGQGIRQSHGDTAAIHCVPRASSRIEPHSGGAIVGRGSIEGHNHACQPNSTCVDVTEPSTTGMMLEEFSRCLESLQLGDSTTDIDDDDDDEEEDNRTTDEAADHRLGSRQEGYTHLLHDKCFASSREGDNCVVTRGPSKDLSSRRFRRRTASNRDFGGGAPRHRKILDCSEASTVHPPYWSLRRKGRTSGVPLGSELKRSKMRLATSSASSSTSSSSSSSLSVSSRRRTPTKPKHRGSLSNLPLGSPSVAHLISNVPSERRRKKHPSRGTAAGSTIRNQIHVVNHRRVVVPPPLESRRRAIRRRSSGSSTASATSSSEPLQEYCSRDRTSLRKPILRSRPVPEHCSWSTPGSMISAARASSGGAQVLPAAASTGAELNGLFERLKNKVKVIQDGRGLAAMSSDKNRVNETSHHSWGTPKRPEMAGNCHSGSRSTERGENDTHSADDSSNRLELADAAVSVSEPKLASDILPVARCSSSSNTTTGGQLNHREKAGRKNGNESGTRTRVASRFALSTSWSSMSASDFPEPPY